ncbi:S-layer homology domain-containing protein, partial [Candidatus Peregrinibacteria bacterium]|nr:S-layer homology domain-containing protein [Candidatus Peregrinibacteria bacterium]
TNYYYYPENVKETVVIEKTSDSVPDKTVIDNKIPKDPVTPEDPEVREEIAAAGEIETAALTCYKPGEIKNYKDADKFGYYKKFVEEFTKIDAVSPGDYQKGTSKLELTPKPIVKGYVDNNFKVFNNATRTEGLKMISNGTCLFQDLDDSNILSLEDQAKKDAAAVYKDFPADHWAKIMAGVTSDGKVEMTQGYKDGTFRPDQPITKAEYGKILVARFCVQQPDECDAAKDKIKKEADPFKERFPDLVGHWGGGEDGWITLGNELKIILGTTDGKFYPDTYITRGDALVLLHNYVVARGLLDDSGNIVKIETKITR